MSDRDQIVDWLRAWANETCERAEKARVSAQRESLNGSAFLLRFVASQIEDGAHTRTKEENQARFAKKLNLPFLPGWDE